MHRNVLTHFPFMNLVIFGQLLFFAIFVGAIIWVYRKKSGVFYQQLSNMPLDDGGSPRD
jgi:cbb3-type cytochrome oxidase subunit 3